MMINHVQILQWLVDVCAEQADFEDIPTIKVRAIWMHGSIISTTIIPGDFLKHDRVIKRNRRLLGYYHAYCIRY